MVMRGYCNGSSADQNPISDGWLRTGDLGRIDPDRNLYIVDRINDIIQVRNYKISATELERILVGYDSIDEAVAFGIESVHDEGEIVIVVLHKNGSHIDKEILKKEVCSSMPRLPVEPEIIFLDAFPRTISGKINRNELKQQVFAILSV